MLRNYLAIFVTALLASALTLLALDRLLWESDAPIPVIALALAISVTFAIYSSRKHSESDPLNRRG